MMVDATSSDTDSSGDISEFVVDSSNEEDALRSSASSSSCADLPEPLKHPLIQNNPLAAIVMRFIKLEKLMHLTAPFPRCQDLPDDYFGIMSPTDKLIAVSHGWHYKMHPDPYGTKVRQLRAKLQEIQDQHEVADSNLYVFFDFLAIPQRPFSADQAERTEEEQDTFQLALNHLDAVFLYAQHFIHLDVPMEVPQDEGAKYSLQGVPSGALQPIQLGAEVVCMGAACAFDTLVTVEGVEVRGNAGEAQKLLAAKDVVDITVERHAWGLPNYVPCSDRGWIYLERFITMVVAAMIDDLAFEKTVFADSVEVLQEIHAGAQCLRQSAAHAALYHSSAAVSANDSNETATSGASVCALSSGSSADSSLAVDVLASSRLQSVLQGFQNQLIRKKFSNASVDKSLNPALRAVSSIRKGNTGTAMSLETKSDADIVRETMVKLVAELGTQWQIVQAQRLGKNRAREKLRAYVIDWMSFSPGFLQQIQEEMVPNPLTLLLCLVLVPLVVVLPPLFLPYDRPDRTWLENWVYTFIGAPWLSGTCYLFVPQWMQVALRVRLPYRCTLFWPFFCALVTDSISPLGFSMVTGIFPCPFTCLFASATYLMCLPLLWLLLPSEAKEDKKAVSRFCTAILIQVILTVIFCMTYPVLNLWLQRVSSMGEYVFIALIFLGGRILVEKIVERASGQLGPDVHPAVIFMCELAYQVALCDFFRNVNSLAAFGVFMGVDLLENLYYLYCFVGGGRSPQGFLPVQATDSVRKAGSGVTNTSSAAGLFCDGSAASVAAVLLLRILADILVPLLFIAVQGALYAGPTRSVNAWVADLSFRDLRRSWSYLAAALLIELAMAGVVWAVLSARGLKPLRFLRGVIVGGSQAYYIAAVTTSIMWFGALQLAHNGCDWSFQLLWVFGSAKWDYGLTWQQEPQLKQES